MKQRLSLLNWYRIMSRLLILTRRSLAPGFQLAGVDAFGADDIETAEELVDDWLKSGEVGLLAIDDGLLKRMDPGLVQRLESSDHLPYLAIPGGDPLGPEASRRYRIAEMIRRAIGFHITFKGEQVEAK
jgi:vacuolar-type H+-ATPase subunit F/Vma7